MRVFLRRDFFFFDSTSFSFSRLLAFETSLTVEIVIAIKPNSVYSSKLQQNIIYTTSRRAKSVRLKNRFFSEEIRRDSSICPRNRTHTGGGGGVEPPTSFFASAITNLIELPQPFCQVNRTSRTGGIMCEIVAIEAVQFYATVRPKFRPERKFRDGTLMMFREFLMIRCTTSFPNVERILRAMAALLVTTITNTSVRCIPQDAFKVHITSENRPPEWSNFARGASVVASRKGRLVRRPNKQYVNNIFNYNSAITIGFS